MRRDMAHFAVTAIITLSASGRRLSIIQDIRFSVPSDVAQALAFRGCTEDGRVLKEHGALPPIRSGRKDFSCRKCNPGFVLLPGLPPSEEFQAAGVTQEELEKAHIKIENHCSELDGDAEKKLILIRNAQSKWNQVTEKFGAAAQSVGMQYKYQDSPLSQVGLRQAQRLAILLRDADGREEHHDAKDSPTKARVRSAMKELDYTDLSKEVKITSGGDVLTNSELLGGLLNHQEELDVLLGKRCAESVFLTSQLTRAIDTFNIAMLQAHLRCSFSYEISSNLQEFEHNRDCEAHTPAGEHPVFRATQRDEYIAKQMEQTFHYMEEQYSTGNIQRFTRNLDMFERQRISGNDMFIRQTIQAEISNLFRGDYENTRYAVFGGHSIWFRYLFKFFGDQQNPICTQLGSSEVTIANVGIVSATLRKVRDTETPYALIDCKWIYLGPFDDFKYEVNAFVMSSVEPRPTDFRFGAKTIVGWKCCCATAFPRRPCLLASSTNRKVRCENVDSWGSVIGSMALTDSGRYSNGDGWKATYGWQDDKNRPQCFFTHAGEP